MVDFQYMDGSMRLTAAGTNVELAAAAAGLINGIYSQMLEFDESVAQEFKQGIQRIIADEASAVWEKHKGGSGTVVGFDLEALRKEKELEEL